MLSQTPISVVRTPNDLRYWTRNNRKSGRTIALVPTMGALHDGHLSLVRTARQYADHVVASIFVNPTQFAPGEDLDSYPRNESEDLEKLAQAGCELAYCPSASCMYPDGDKTRITVEDISFVLEGEFRPHFFIGVATIVSRLLIHCEPDFAVFGEKDYQQLLIIRRMVRDLGLPVEIIGAPTIREQDGLAMSSRNVYLSDEERRQAGGFASALEQAALDVSKGVAISVAVAKAYEAIDEAGLSPIDYVAVRDAATLDDLGNGRLQPGQKARILGAAWMGKTRLIDNRAVERN